MAEDKLFFVGQKAIICKGNDVLVLFNKNKTLDFPGGKVQDGETNFDESLKREIREETTLEVDIIKPFARWAVTFEYGHNIGKTVFLIGFICNYKSGEVEISEDHSGYKWVNKENYKSLDNGSEYFKILDLFYKHLPV